MKYYKEKSWKCQECGHQMNVSSTLSSNQAPPKEGDATVCIRCSAVYFRHNSRWRVAKPEDWLALTVDEYQDLVKTVSAVTRAGRQN